MIKYLRIVPRTLNRILAIAIVFAFSGLTQIFAQAAGDFRSNAASFSWGTAGSWQTFSGGSWITATTYPGQNAGTGTVTIQPGHAVSLNVSPANVIAALTFTNSGTSASVTFSGTNALSVSGNITIDGSGKNNNAENLLDVAGGNLSVTGTLTITGGNSGVNTKRGTLQIGGGSASITGNITTSANQNGRIVFNGSGTLVEAGAFSIGNAAGITTGTGTIEYNGATQTVSNVIDYNNLTLSGTGNKTIGTGINITGTLSMQGTAAAITNAPAFGAGGTLEYKGSSAQTATAIEFPSASGPTNLVINNSNGVTSGLTRTISGTLFLTTGTFANTNLTLASGATISRNTGLLANAPTFTTTVNVVYTGSSATNTGNEIPVTSTVLSGFGVTGSGTVSLTTDATAKGAVNINGGNLIINGTKTLTLVTGAVCTITSPSVVTVNGTLSNSSTTTGSISIGASGGMVVSNGGTYIHNTTAAIATPQGRMTLQSGSNFIYRGSSTLKPATTISGKTYSNLTFESSSGTLTLSNTDITGTGGLTVSGSLSVGGSTFSSPNVVSLSLAGLTTTAVTVGGTTTTVAGNSLTTNTFTTSGTNTGFVSAGDVTINGTLSLTSDITGNGNWTVGAAGTQTNNSKVVFFQGTSTQTITKTGGGSITFAGVTVNKASGVLTLANDITIGNTLTLTAGTFAIGSSALTLNGAVSRTSGSLAGSNTSNLTIGGTAGSLFFATGGTNNFLKNFTINTASSATLGNALNITAYDGTSSEGVLTVSGTGVLTTGGFLTIKSNANGTARIAAGNTAGAYISGDATVERYIPQNSSKAWRLLASNTSGQTINAAWQEGVVGAMNNPNPGFGTKISSSGASLGAVQALGFDTLSLGKSIFKYIQSTDVLDFVPNTSSTQLSSEHGYFVFIRGDRSPGQFGAGAPSTTTVLRSKGALFQGDQAAVSLSAGQYALVRNPYPSRLDMRQIARTGGLVDAYQVWDPKLTGAFGVGAYQTFTKNSGTGNYEVSPGGGSYGVNGSVQNFIESGAAFFAQASLSTGTVRVLENSKAGGSQVVFRPSTPLSGSSRVLFNVYANNVGSTDVVDGGFIDFDDAYSNAVDASDVRKSTNFGENFGILRSNTELVVERRKSVTSNDTIFFKMYQLRQMSYRIDFEATGFDSHVINAVLEDKFTGTKTSLNLTVTTSYTFTVTGAAASFAADRFRLVLSLGNTFSGTGNWTDNARWSAGAPPATGDALTIAAGANATLNTDYTVSASLTMTATSTLTVNPTKTLSVANTGVANLNGQSVTFKSDNTGYGSLGKVLGTLNGATNVTVERYIPNNSFRSWRLLSVPTFGSGQTIRQAWQEGIANPSPLQNNLPDFGTQITGAGSNAATSQAAGFDNAGGSASLLSWNGTAWSGATTTNIPIASQKAWFLYVRGERSKGVSGLVTDASATTLRTNGTVYTGSQVTPVPSGSFMVVANIYPSAIDFTSLARSNVNNLFYIWDSKKQNGNSLGVYQAFSGTNGFEPTISGGSYNIAVPNTTIESGQAFFVTGGATPGGGSITLSESAKISGSNGNLGFRPSASPAKISSRLYNANNDMLDANVVVFDKAYNNTVDADDAVKLGNPGANFAIEKESRILAIEGRMPVANNDVVQFRMWNLPKQNYKLELVAANMQTTDVTAVLEDKYLQTDTPVDISSTTAINFAVDANAASSAADRFRIVFKQAKPLPVIAGTANAGVTVSPNPVNGQHLNLQFTQQPAGKYSIRLISTTGQLLLDKTLQHAGGNSAQSIGLPSRITSGVYELQVVTPGNIVTVQKLIVR